MKAYNSGRLEQGQEGALKSKVFSQMNEKMRKTEERARELKATIFAMNQFQLNYNKRMRQSYTNIISAEKERF